MPFTLGLQTFRSGSRGVADKNMLVVGGKHLFEYNLAQLQKTPSIDIVCISTDYKLSRDDCVLIPRPHELASNSASYLQVIRHAVRHMEEYQSKTADIIAVVFGNSVSAHAFDLEAAIKFLRRNEGFDSVQSVSPLTMYNPLKAYKMTDGVLECFIDKEQHERYLIPGVPPSDRDSTEKPYFFNGSFWICRRAVVFADDTSDLVYPWLGKKVKGWVQPFCFDVDEPFQLDLLRLMVGKNG